MTLIANDIANQALDLLLEAPMTNYLTETTSEALWFQRNYETTRDAEFEAHPWRFAAARVAINANATAPAFGWLYRYPLPADFMRVGYLNYLGIFENPPIPHEIEGPNPADAVDLAAAPRGWLLCDQSTTIYLVYIRQIVNPDKWVKLFVKTMAAGLARDAAHWLTGKQSMVPTLEGKYDLAIKKAKRANAILSTAERAFDSDVIAARYIDGGICW